MKKTITRVLGSLCLASVSLLAQTPLPYFSGFDTPAQQSGWTLYRKGSTISSAWTVAAQNFYSAPNALLHFYPVGEQTDDWYVSPPFQFPAGGKIDSLRFSFIGFSPSPALTDTIAVYALTGSPDPALATKTLLLDFRGTNYVSDGLWRDTSAVPIPANAGSTYLAFKYVGNSSWLDARFDNLAISGSAPVASFSISPVSPCIGQPLLFSDLSTGNPTSWNWTFPGGTPSVSAVMNPTVSYSSAGIHSVTLMSANASGTSAAVTQTIEVTACTGLNATKISTEQVLMFPNPANEKLTLISLKEDAVSYTLYDASGRRVRGGILQNNCKEIVDITDLSQGVYFLRLQSKEEHELRKVFKH